MVGELKIALLWDACCCCHTGRNAATVSAQNPLQETHRSQCRLEYVILVFVLLKNAEMPFAFHRS
jgi:hypothetical protein